MHIKYICIYDDFQFNVFMGFPSVQISRFLFPVPSHGFLGLSVSLFLSLCLSVSLCFIKFQSVNFCFVILYYIL